jgi:Family of unknown function (DUF6879)
MLLDLPAIDAFIEERFSRSAFRLEVLDRYTVDSDQDNVERYLAGGPAPYWADGDEWMDKLARDRAAGKRNYRVHVLRSPLNDYLRYECEWGYVYTSKAGEDIYILDLAETPRPDGLIGEDFYLIDDEHVLLIRYDDEGRLLGGEPLAASETPRYRRCRDVAMAHAQPFGRYWEEHPQYWRENWLRPEGGR